MAQNCKRLLFGDLNNPESVHSVPGRRMRGPLPSFLWHEPTKRQRLARKDGQEVDELIPVLAPLLIKRDGCRYLREFPVSDEEPEDPYIEEMGHRYLPHLGSLTGF